MQVTAIQAQNAQAASEAWKTVNICNRQRNFVGLWRPYYSSCFLQSRGFGAFVFSSRANWSWCLRIWKKSRNSLAHHESWTSRVSFACKQYRQYSMGVSFVPSFRCTDCVYWPTDTVKTEDKVQQRRTHVAKSSRHYAAAAAYSVETRGQNPMGKWYDSYEWCESNHWNQHPKCIFSVLDVLQASC